MNVKEFADGVANNAPVLGDIQVTSTAPVGEAPIGDATAGGITTEVVEATEVTEVVETPEATEVVETTDTAPDTVAEEGGVDGDGEKSTEDGVESSDDNGSPAVDSDLVLVVSDDTDLDTKG